MNALPVGELVHALPRRVRIRVPEARGDPDLLARLQQAMAAVPRIGEVRSSPATGSIVLEGMRITPEELADIARERGWFDLQVSRDGRPGLWSESLERVQRLRGAPALRYATGSALLALTVWKLASGGPTLPPALQLGYFAIDAFRGFPRL